MPKPIELTEHQRIALELLRNAGTRVGAWFLARDTWPDFSARLRSELGRSLVHKGLLGAGPSSSGTYRLQRDPAAALAESVPARRRGLGLATGLPRPAGCKPQKRRCDAPPAAEMWAAEGPPPASLPAAVACPCGRLGTPGGACPGCGGRLPRSSQAMDRLSQLDRLLRRRVPLHDLDPQTLRHVVAQEEALAGESPTADNLRECHDDSAEAQPGAGGEGPAPGQHARNDALGQDAAGAEPSVLDRAG
jgi:hypothetical protein